jgi:hypothetical protein
MSDIWTCTRTCPFSAIPGLRPEAFQRNSVVLHLVVDRASSEAARRPGNKDLQLADVSRPGVPLAWTGRHRVRRGPCGHHAHPLRGGVWGRGALLQVLNRERNTHLSRGCTQVFPPVYRARPAISDSDRMQSGPGHRHLEGATEVILWRQGASFLLPGLHHPADTPHPPSRQTSAAPPNAGRLGRASWP